VDGSVMLIPNKSALSDSEGMKNLRHQHAENNRLLAHLSDKRTNYHKLFIELDTKVLGGLIAIFISALAALNTFVPIDGGAIVTVIKAALVGVNVIGFLMSPLWWSIVIDCRQRSKAIALIQQEIEEHFPAKVFKKEYEMTRCGLRNIYRCFRLTDVWMPWFFAAIHIAAGVGIWYAFDFIKLGI